MSKLQPVRYRGHARDISFKSAQLKAPDEAAQIEKRGRRVLKGMEDQRQADLKRRVKWLQQYATVYEAEKQNREANKRLDDLASQNAKNSLTRQHKIDKESSQTRIDNDRRRLESIQNWSKTAFKALEDIKKNQDEKLYQEGIIDAYRNGIDPTKLLAQDIKISESNMAAHVIEINGQIMEAQGAPHESVQDVRRMARPAYQAGRERAELAMLGNQWKTWAQEQLAVNDQIKINGVPSIEDPNKLITITPKEAVTAAQKEAVLEALLVPYLIQRNVYGHNVTFYSEMLTKARNGSDEIIASARLTDLKAASERSKSEIIETLFDDPSLETIRAAFVRAPFLFDDKGNKMGDAGAREFMHEQIFTGARADGRFVFNDDQVQQYLEWTLPGMDTPVGIQYSSEVNKWLVKRKEQAKKIYSQTKGLELHKEQLAKNEAIALINDPNTTDEQIFEIYNSLSTTFGVNSEAAKHISSNFIETTRKDGINDINYELQWQRLAAVGNLKIETINAAPVSLYLKTKYRQKVNRQTGMSSYDLANKDIADAGLESIRTKMRIEVKHNSLSNEIEDTFSPALAHAQIQYRKDFLNAMVTGKAITAVDAHKLAIEAFYKEWSKRHNEDDGGKYAVKMYRTNADDEQIRDPHFAEFTMESSAGYVRPSMKKKQQWLQADETDALDNKVLIDNNRLKSWLRRVKEGHTPNIDDYMPDVKELSVSIEGLEDLEIVNRQLVRAGLGEIPMELFKQNEEARAHLNARHQAFIDRYPNENRTLIGLYGSLQDLLGGTWRKPNTLNPVLSGAGQ